MTQICNNYDLSNTNIAIPNLGCYRRQLCPFNLHGNNCHTNWKSRLQHNNNVILWRYTLVIGKSKPSPLECEVTGSELFKPKKILNLMEIIKKSMILQCEPFCRAFLQNACNLGSLKIDNIDFLIWLLSSDTVEGQKISQKR